MRSGARRRKDAEDKIQEAIGDGRTEHCYRLVAVGQKGLQLSITIYANKQQVINTSLYNRLLRYLRHPFYTLQHTVYSLELSFIISVHSQLPPLYFLPSYTLSSIAHTKTLRARKMLTSMARMILKQEGCKSNSKIGVHHATQTQTSPKLDWW